SPRWPKPKIQKILSPARQGENYRTAMVMPEGSGNEPQDPPSNYERGHPELAARLLRGPTADALGNNEVPLAYSNRAMHVHHALRCDSIGSMRNTYRKKPCHCGHGLTIHRAEPGRTRRPRAVCYHPGCKCKNYRPA